MKINFRLRQIALAFGVASLSASSAFADDPFGWVNGAAGAVVGGAIGNQIGDGKGRAVATAAGAAAGTMIASGCTASAQSGVGALIGGLLGYQVGGGNGKNVMAGVGASLGAWLASDCSPVAAASAPVALPVPAFRFNGLSMQPMSGFPIEAFHGVPPILTTNDLEAAREVSVMLAASAKESYQAGDTETAMLKLYWAKKIGLAALAVTSSSLDAVASMSTKGGKTQAMIPAKTLVVLPAYDPGTSNTENKIGAWLSGEGRFAGTDWKNSFQVADNGVLGLFNGVMGIVNAVSGLPGVQQAGRPETPAKPGAQPMPTPGLAGLNEGQPLQLANGVILVKQQGNLTAYNPGDTALALPLDALDFLPRAPELSEGRKAAAGLMKRMRENLTRWSFNVYGQDGKKFHNFTQKPNRIADRLLGNKAVAYFDEDGNVTANRQMGEIAFKQNNKFKTAITVLDSIDKSQATREFANQCQNVNYSAFGSLSGQYSDVMQSVCFTGTYAAPVQVATRTFWIGEAGQAVQTLESMIDDQRFLGAMRAALVGGKVTSDILSVLGTPAGNVESALQCFGRDSLSQMAAVEGVRIGHAKPGSRLAGAGTGYAKARILGWQPDPAEWGLERVANCIGTVPLVGGVIGGGVKVAGKLGGEVLDALPAVDKVATAFKLFDTPRSFGKYQEGVRVAGELFPENAAAARFTKATYDAIMSGYGMVQLHDGFREVATLVAGR